MLLMTMISIRLTWHKSKLHKHNSFSHSLLVAFEIHHDTLCVYLSDPIRASLFRLRFPKGKLRALLYEDCTKEGRNSPLEYFCNATQVHCTWQTLNLYLTSSHNGAAMRPHPTDQFPSPNPLWSPRNQNRALPHDSTYHV